jgi:putative transposase
MPIGFYHVYDRGVSKETTFIDAQDFNFFQTLLSDLLSSRPFNRQYRRKTYGGLLEIYAFCLMGNHYHLLCKQLEEGALSAFMQSLGVTYTMYFNKRHNRVGSLFDRPFRARQIKSDEDLINLSRYVHRNPLDLGKDLLSYRYSSFRYYVSDTKPAWLNTELLLGAHGRSSYQNFVLAA